MTRKQCDDCGNDTFIAHMGIKQSRASLSDPRQPGVREVVEQIECSECGATFSAR